jgi:hypothetical protein
VFFAPRDNPRIAGAVFVENGLHGSNAAIVAKHAMEVFFAKEEGRPLPPLKVPGMPEPAAPDPESEPIAPPMTTGPVAALSPDHRQWVICTT